MILVTGITDPESAELKAARVLETIEQTVVTSAGELSISCSIGVSLCPIHGNSLDTLLKAADQAMYGVKQLGRRGVAMTESPQA